MTVKFLLKLAWHHFLDFRIDVETFLSRANYANILAEFSLKRNPPYKILFMVSNTCKWKLQALYDLLKRDSIFEPTIVLVRQDTECGLTGERLRMHFNECRQFFDRRKMTCVCAYDFKRKKDIPFKRFHPDIVFYQTPWSIPSVQSPYKVSKYALTCYVPYYVSTNSQCERGIQEPLHRLLFRHYLFNQFECDFLSWNSTKFNYSGTVEAVGHPTLDQIRQGVQSYTGPQDLVIYAPHWSLSDPRTLNDLRFSTFLENGRQILDYAKQHPEIKWAFKPHPTLRGTLAAVMSQDEIDDYYSSWEKIGEACYTGDYVSLFARSRALITDCDSFLAEYGCTGKPIVHLISKGFERKKFLLFSDLFENFYQVRTNDELWPIFKMVVEEGKDPKLNSRRMALEKCELNNHDSSANRIYQSILKMVNGHQ